MGDILGDVTGSTKATKAATAAAQTATTENNALSGQIYNSNKALLSPYSERGNAAGNSLNALLGVGNGASPAPAAGGYYGGTGGYTSPITVGAGAVDDAGQPAYSLAGGQNYDASAITTPQGNPAPANGGTSFADANAGLNQYLGLSDYDYQQNQAAKGVTSNAAATGMLGSGSALKALQDRGLQIRQGYLTNYLGQLANQQAVGLSGASAVAGVGNNYQNNVTAQNNALASTVANANLAKAGNNASVLGGLAKAGATLAAG